MSYLDDGCTVDELGSRGDTLYEYVGGLDTARDAGEDFFGDKAHNQKDAMAESELMSGCSKRRMPSKGMFIPSWMKDDPTADLDEIKSYDAEKVEPYTERTKDDGIEYRKFQEHLPKIQMLPDELAYFAVVYAEFLHSYYDMPMDEAIEKTIDCYENNTD